METEERGDDPSRVIGILKEIGSKVTEELSLLIPNLLSYLGHDDPVIVRESLSAGTSIFSAVLREIALQLYNSGKIENWLEKLWLSMVQFKNAVCDILMEPGSIGSKVFATKFLEICFLLFTTDGNDGEIYKIEGMDGNFNFSWLAQSHPTLNPTLLRHEASSILDNFLNILKYAHRHSGTLVITVINCLASIAKKRPVHYDTILSAFLGFDPKFDISTGSHAMSIQYALRIALLGFLRCIHPSIYETKDKLLRILRARYPGEVTEHTIRQMEKLSRGTERTSRDIQPTKDDPPLGQASTDGMPSKRARFNGDLPFKVTNDSQDAHHDAVNNISLDASLVNSDLTPAEKMIVAIGALLAEGDKGAQSLELLFSQIHADLLADIIIETMTHLPKTLPALSGRNGGMQPSSQTSLSGVSSQSSPSFPASSSSQSSSLPSDVASTAIYSSGISIPASDAPQAASFVSDIKRDPRRDPRRLDPRRAATPVGVSSVPLNLESDGDIQNGLLYSPSMSTPSEDVKLVNAPVSTVSKNELEQCERVIDPAIGLQASEEKLEVLNSTFEELPSELVPSAVNVADDELATFVVISENDDNDDNNDDKLEYDPSSFPVSVAHISEDISRDLPELPLYVDLTNEQKKALSRLAVTRLIDGHKQIQATDCCHLRLPLLARLVAQIGADDDLLSFFRTRIILDYHHHEGHDLAMHILYHLHTLMISELEENSSLAANNYEKFLVAIATTLLDSLPALDKSFSKLLVDAPFLPESALKLLEDLCQLRGYKNHTKDDCDGDRVGQGLGAVCCLILERPPYRQACLDIVLKCSVHSHDEVRGRAIRLVANKLFLLPYASETIEKFARNMMLSVVDLEASAVETKPMVSGEQMIQAGTQDTSFSGSHNSGPQPSENEPPNDIQSSPHSIPAMSLLHAQRQTSLFFALCSKKPSLIGFVFDLYGRAQKVVKQSIHRHVPSLVRTLGPSYPELLQLISDPPEGSENLIMLVLQILTEESTPCSDLIAAVRHLYDTKLKDVAILIPMLSSLSKDEVLPIFPRLLDLPLEKFQAALARILQGSAHTGPALTPVEVLVAIHSIDPVKDGVALKKITDACTACFEQRTVFTQNVLAKSLNLMVEQVPLPLLFMRTVIQAIGAFPALVDFVMEILSKLVSKQIWKMPKLWVGFLKLVSQTHPHSFTVLLQLPPPQLENALNRYGNLRGPLMAYANQPSIRSTLTRQNLQLLGLGEPQQAPTRSFIPPASDTGSVHGATLS